MCKFSERTLQILGLVGLPADVRLLFNILSGLVAAVLTGTFAYAQQASPPVLGLLVLGAFAVFVLASIPIGQIILRSTRSLPSADELEGEWQEWRKRPQDAGDRQDVPQRAGRIGRLPLHKLYVHQRNLRVQGSTGV